VAELKNKASPEYIAESADCHLWAVKGIFIPSEKRQTAYTCKICFCSSLYTATRQGYLAISPHSWFATILGSSHGMCNEMTANKQ
jgi:hypothetical protein